MTSSSCIIPLITRLLNKYILNLSKASPLLCCGSKWESGRRLWSGAARLQGSEWNILYKGKCENQKWGNHSLFFVEKTKIPLWYFTFLLLWIKWRKRAVFSTFKTRKLAVFPFLWHGLLSENPGHIQCSGDFEAEWLRRCDGFSLNFSLVNCCEWVRAKQKKNTSLDGFKTFPVTVAP